MKKAIGIYSAFVLCGLLLLTMLTNVGISYASSVAFQPIQVQSSGFMDAQGTINVSATCPQNYHVQSGSAQITSSELGQNAQYSVLSNGPDARGTAWTVSIQKNVTGSLNVTVTAICAKK